MIIKHSGNMPHGQAPAKTKAVHIQKTGLNPNGTRTEL